jgi:GT2 family glycosyltransferase/glycosyltransferase involved in cell wall biosynthesis
VSGLGGSDVTDARPVTVIIPVYRGAAATARCIESVRRHQRPSEPRDHVLVIDDCSPEPEVHVLLESLEGADDLTVLRNDRNLGFAATANRGISHADGDIVLLNADTVVTEGWLDRLGEAALEPDTATVTPLTNFGSICTLPPEIIECFALDGPDPEIDACAAFVKSHSVDIRPEVISAVGFCMYITRASLDTCGPLDDATFGRGYGEEVDFCLRATRAGFRHIVEDSTFVYHRGAESFGEQGRAEGLARGSALLHDRYPYFGPANRSERRLDPLAVPVAALRMGLRPRDETRPHVLHILHAPSRVGGTERHVQLLMQAMQDDFDFSVLTPVDSGFSLRTRWMDPDGDPVEQDLLLPGAARQVRSVHDEAAGRAVEMALDLFDVHAVHVQNLIGHSLAPLAVLEHVDVPVVCSVRDLYLACPHHWLLFENERPCGIPDDLDLCGRCLPATQGFDREYLERFRSTVRARLDAVDWWVFASASAEANLRRAYDIDPARIARIPHGALVDPTRRVTRPDEDRLLDGPLRLALVGRGWKKKGLHLLNACAEDLAGTGIELHHFGELREKVSPRVRAHGLYRSEDLADLLDEHGIQIVLLPGPYSETFGHTMTESLLAGRPVIGSRHGAIGERIRAHGVGWTVEPTDPDGLRRLIENLDRSRPEVLRATRRAMELPIPDMAETAPRYAALYRHRPEAPSRPSVRPPEHQEP